MAVTSIYKYLRDVAMYQLHAPGRRYHNAVHTQTVLRACLDILQEDGLPEALWMAAMFHDAVYIPGYEHNEAASAKLLSVALNQLTHVPGYATMFNASRQAQDLILATQVANHVAPCYVSDDPLAYVLLDADLSGLGTRYDTFKALQCKIIEEHGLPATMLEARNASGVFLKQFLKRPYIYHTQYGRQHWEEQARSNINCWIFDNQLPE